MSVDKLIIAVPARLNSLRLPGKVLIDIAGKPMLKRVLDRCKLVKESSAVVLCTDSKEIKNLADHWGVKVLMTSEKCTSGTDRISSVINELISIAWGVKYKPKEILNIERAIAITCAQAVRTLNSVRFNPNNVTLLFFQV